jgi:hypothetical protein
VYLVCGYLPNNSFYIRYLNQNVTAGKGLFIFGGYYPIFAESDPDYDAFKNNLPVEFKEPFTTEEELYLDQDWVGQIELKVHDAYLWNDGQALDQDILQRSVVWESSPLVKERIFVKDAPSDAKVLVYRPEQGRVAPLKFLKGEPLVSYRAQGAGKILWVSMVVGLNTAEFANYTTQGAGPYWERVKIPNSGVDHTVEANKPFYLWPYFNFFLFQSARFLGGGLSTTDIDTYAEWPFSPIPHQTEATLWMTFVAGLWVFNFVLFFTLGRKKKSAGREVVTPAAAGSEKELTAEERKALETPKSEGKTLITEEKKPGEAPIQTDAKKRELLARMEEMFKASRRIKIDDASKILGIDRTELLGKVIAETAKLGVKVDGEYLVVGDNVDMNTWLDDQFSAWDGKERKKDGKIEKKPGEDEKK